MLRLVRILLLLLALPYAAQAAGYPEKPIRLIVGYPPGGATDTLARLIANELSAHLQQAIVVENHPGAGGSIATSQVSRAPPDGYTLLLASSASFSIAPSLFEQLPYKTDAFTPIGLIARVPQILVAGPTLPVHDLAGLIAYAKAKPGALSYASFGNGSSTHLVGEEFKRLAGVDIVHVPYKGSASSVTDLLGGQTQLMFDTVQSALPYIRADRVVPIAIGSPTRSPLLPSVPTFDELNFKGVDVRPWFGVSAPARLPADVRDKLIAAMRASQAAAPLRKAIEDMGAEPSTFAGDEFRRFIEDQEREWGAVAKSSGATIR